MSDSFADLWNNTAPIKPQPTAPKLGSIASTSTPGIAGRKPAYDAFSLLAATNGSSSSSNSGSRPLTPSMSAQAPRMQTSTSAPGAGQGQGSRAGAGLGSGDAFSGLLSGSLTGSGNNASMSIADRAAASEQAKRDKWMQENETRRKADAVWGQLDALSSGSDGGSKSAGAAPSSSQDEWAFDSLAPTPAAASRKSTPQPAILDDDDWGLGDFASAAKSTTSKKPSSSSQRQAASRNNMNAADSLLDLDNLDPIAHSNGSTNTDPDEDFDFGNREDRLLGNNSDDGQEDDILGALSRPVEQRPERVSPSANTAPTPPPRSRTTATRSSSPPPHLIGQIVEMGFTPQQARVALASTDTGLDVQAALETLLSNGAADDDADGQGAGFVDSDDDGQVERRPPPRREQRRAGRGQDRDVDGASATARARQQVLAGDDEMPSRRRQRPAANARDRDRDPPGSGPGSGTGTPAINIQDQADKILAQASEIGFSMFTRANALWKEGKEKVQKVYEERAASAASGEGGAGSGASGGAGRGTGVGAGRGGRPKWMQQQSEDGADDQEWPEPPVRTKRKGEEGYRDEDGDENETGAEPLPQRPPRRKPSASGTQAASPPPASRHDSPIPDSSQRKNLLSSLFDEPAAYVPKRRRPQVSASAFPAASSSSVPTSARQAARVSPPPLRTRQTVSASSSALAACNRHKAHGGEMFKLGRYAEAESAYTSAISVIPSGHLLLIQLYNNRALTSIKTGDTNGAVADCTASLEIIGEDDYHPTREAKVSGGEEDGAEVDLADGWVKALRRRAEAYEGREKWEMALKDWERIGRAEWAGRWRGDAAKGAGRCRRMTAMNVDSGDRVGDGSSTGGARPATAAAKKPVAAPPRRPPPRAAAPAPPSEALNRLREASNAQDAEEAERYRLKDAIDAKLFAWKGGKEANIRALLASLDNVLWPELGWQKIGMAELVMPNQVKIRYTKAIAKLHPDKLNAQNTTVEQRMIANGVFGTLNEAWNSFTP